MDIAIQARCSRRAVTAHSKHLIEVLYEQVRAARAQTVIYAPTTNVYMVAQDEEKPAQPAPQVSGDRHDLEEVEDIG
jgi:hypothetical protein